MVQKIQGKKVVRAYRLPVVKQDAAEAFNDKSRIWVNSICDNYRKKRVPFAICKENDLYHVYLHRNMLTA